MNWEETAFTCPHCWESQALTLDPQQTDTFVQDCAVCCNPIEFTPLRDDDGLVVGVDVTAE